MSAALKLPTPTPEPDPPRAGTDMPRRLGRVLNLVRKLIDYGKQLAATVQQRAGTPGFAFLVRPFGTADIAVILARITCGLRRAAMLEAKLCKRAERGRDLTVPPIRLPAIRVPGAAREAAPRDVQPADPPRTRASPASPPRKRSPRRCVAARSAPSSSISAAISASRPAASIGRSGTKSITPSWCMAAAPSASSTTWRSGYGPPWTPATPPTNRNPDAPRLLNDCRCPPPARPEAKPASDFGQDEAASAVRRAMRRG